MQHRCQEKSFVARKKTNLAGDAGLGASKRRALRDGVAGRLRARIARAGCRARIRSRVTRNGEKTGMARSLCALRRPVTPSQQRRRSTRGTRALRAADATASASVRNAAVVNARQRARTTHRAHWSVGGAAGGVRVTVGAPQRRDASARRNASRDERLRPDVLAIGGASYFRHDARGVREPSRSVRHGVGGHTRRADAAAPSARSRVPRRRAAWRGGSRRSAHKERATPVLSPFELRDF